MVCIEDFKFFTRFVSFSDFPEADNNSVWLFWHFKETSSNWKVKILINTLLECCGQTPAFLSVSGASWPSSGTCCIIVSSVVFELRAQPCSPSSYRNEDCASSCCSSAAEFAFCDQALLDCDQASQAHHEGHWVNVFGVTWMMMFFGARLQHVSLCNLEDVLAWKKKSTFYFLELRNLNIWNVIVMMPRIMEFIKKKSCFALDQWAESVSLVVTRKQSSYWSAKNTSFWRYSCSSEGEKGALILWDERKENGSHLGEKYSREESLTTWLQSWVYTCIYWLM